MEKALKGGETPSGFYKVCSGDGAPKDISRAICPIIRSCPHTGKFALVGTGFFIAAYGVVMTAKNVLEDVFDREGNAIAALGIIQFLEDNKYILRHFLRYQSYPDSDVAVAIAAPALHTITKEPLRNEVLKLDAKEQAQGDQVVACAYPNSKVYFEAPFHHLKFRADYYDGKLEQWFPNGRDRTLLPNPCWLTSIPIHEGASGGPVFNRKGLVFAINSTSFSEKSISFVSSISHALNLAVEVVVPPETMPKKYTLLELSNLGHIFVT